MRQRRIGWEGFGFGNGSTACRSSLDDLAKLIDWMPIEPHQADIASAAKGEPAWPSLALFKAMLLTVWSHLSDVTLAEGLDDRWSFRRFCGFSALERTPERTAFVRFCKARVARGLDKALSRAGADRENLRHMDAQLWRTPDEMAGARQGGCPAAFHRNCRQPQAHADDPCGCSVTSVGSP